MRTVLKLQWAKQSGSRSGFALAEFLIAAAVLLILSSFIFGMLVEVQQSSSYQAEVHSVLNNTRIAMQTVQRHIRQAGNDPLGAGIIGITAVSAQEIRIRSDITGSAGPGNPDKGDPDGDTNDSGENIGIRFNSRSRSLEIVPEGGGTQIVAGSISGLSFLFYDADGNLTAAGSEIRRIGVSISGSSLQKDPRTGKAFGVQLNSEILILT